MGAFSFINQRTFTQRKTRKPTGKNIAYGEFEPRQMLAGIVWLADTSQVLIGGTPQIDSATVTENGSSLVVNQRGFGSRTFQTAGVRSVIFVGLGGDDFFTNNSNIPSFAYGGAGNDQLTGGFRNDRLFGGVGNDLVEGRGGDDFISGDFGNDRVIGGNGDDTLLGISGTNFLLAGRGNDEVYGGVGRDIIRGDDGDDLLVGSNGDDEIFGEDGNDRIFAGAGRDNTRGGLGNDRIFGQNGNDIINGGLGEDFLSGNAGNDLFTGEFNDDLIYGGEGVDRAVYSGEIGDYGIEFFGVNSTVNDQRDVRADGFDRLFAVEDLQFSNALQRVGAPLIVIEPPVEPPLVVVPPTTPGFEVVTIQPVIVSNDDGSNSAEFFGNANQEADIKERIDVIFAAARIDVEWLPAVTWNNTFANVGEGDGERTGDDLGAIRTQGDDAGLGSTNPLVIDMYFVERVPGFSDLGESFANGLAFLGQAGIAMQTGDDLVATAGGRTVVAEVAAHEIGHNLGLEHLEAAGNLMAPGGFEGGGDELNDEQIAIAINSNLSVVV